MRCRTEADFPLLHFGFYLKVKGDRTVWLLCRAQNGDFEVYNPIPYMS